MNESKTLDLGEPFCPNIAINIEQIDTTIYGNSLNGGLAFLGDGTYTFSFNEILNENWELTTDSVSYTLNIGNTSNDTIFFGVRPINNISEVNSVIVAPPARCNELIIFNNIVQNLGTTTVSGTLWFEIDENILDSTFIDPPDTIVEPNIFGWHFTNLYPGHSLTKQMDLTITGPPVFPVGDSLVFNSWVEFSDINGSHESDQFEYISEVQCSYDPNDKLVNPVYPDNYALMGEDLVYTIRFQNTGNAEAYDVVIRDTLDENLNPETFSVISSSHEEVLSTSLTNDRFLSFDFRDIYLPDSTSNFEGSQGYVAYRIKVYDGIPEETIINNSAGIYFDLNPPVITNTTENVMLSTFDFDEDGFELWNDCDDMNAEINPDAEEIPNNGIDEDCDGEDMTDAVADLNKFPIEIYPNPTTGQLTIVLPDFTTADLQIKDYTGKTVLQKGLQQKTNVSLADYPAGVYLLMIQSADAVWMQRVVRL